MNTILNYKNIKFIILLGLLFNIFVSYIVINNFDELRIREAGDPIHSIIRSDTDGFFNDADSLIKRFKSKEKPLINTEYHRSFLPQIFIASYFYVIDADEGVDIELLQRLLLPGTASALDASMLTLRPCRVVTPRLGTISPWSSKATDIAKNCGFK